MMSDTESRTAGADNIEPSYSNNVLESVFDMSAPQPQYLAMIQQQHGLLRATPGLAVALSREVNDFVCRHHEVFTNEVDMGMGNVRPTIPLQVDPPHHSKYRKILDPLFAPKRMDAQEEDIANRVNRFMDTFATRGECNFTEDFAELFPSSVFLGLMGMPESELHTFLHIRDGILHVEKLVPEAHTDLKLRRRLAEKAGQELYTYFEGELDKRRKQPQNDLLTHFLQAEVDGEKLSLEDILDICFLLFIAGLDTVSDSLTCMYAFLATHPGHRRQIVEHPEIIPHAVEEMLRFETPSPGLPRLATQAVTPPNEEIVLAGTLVTPLFGAANMDPAVFDDPLEVRFDRTPNPHVAFGAGVHRCLGSHLARRELRVTLREWHKRIPDYQLKPGHETLEYPLGLRRVRDLTLAWN